MKALYRQFGHPSGPLGWFVGQLMALKNGARSRFALELLAASPGERVLEIGFGPGVDLARLLAAVGHQGRVAGVDVSAEMVRQAGRRNRAALAARALELGLAPATALPFGSASFDAVYSSNSVQFWADLVQGLGEVRRVLRPGGRAVVVVQPMRRGARSEDSRRWAERLEAGMREAGFESVTLAERELRPVLAVAGLGRTSSAGR